ncbi:molybdopterin-dependent oxidoreductase [Amycolatopsis magusensis]|uniref:molybdopterin-dependent oxidoreductase n=1 Tax=Amycolatopsis magusensis TaxID=882444 RepID=UPI0037AD7BB8
MVVLPPGQWPAERRRFGLPEFARVRPEVPARPVVTVTGVVRRPVQFDVTELLGAGLQVQTSDLHCVTTWSALRLEWGGVPFRHVHELLARRVRPHPDCRWVTFAGLDGYRSCLAIEDALADDVLLADSLAGQPLDEDAGAPLRLVAPAHYGYKSVRHVCAIEYRTAYDKGSAGWKAHRRGRVELEERSAWLPGRIWRSLWRRFADVGNSAVLEVDAA